jgi:hypothetical protein
VWNDGHKRVSVWDDGHERVSVWNDGHERVSVWNDGPLQQLEVQIHTQPERGAIKTVG